MRHVLVASSILVGLFAVIVGCRKSSSSSTGVDRATRVKVQLNWLPEPEFGGLYAARELGAFKGRGLEVDLVPGGPGSPVVQLVAAGKADFGVAAGEDVVIARARGADVVAVFATFQTSPQGVMVRASRGLASLGDLKSGTLAIEPGSPFGAFLKRRHGFPGVTIVPYDGGVARFLADPDYAQQCFVTSEPFAVKRQSHGIMATKVFLGADDGFDPYANVVITRAAALRERLPFVKAFVAATAEGWRAYLDDPRATNAVMQKLNPSLDADTFAAAADAQKQLVENADTRAHRLGWMTGERWRALGAQLVDLGIVGAQESSSNECFTTVALAP